MRAGHGHGLVPARFAWLDEVSGERLLVDFEGSEAFFHELEAAGFERQPAEPGLPADEPRVPRAAGISYALLARRLPRPMTLRATQRHAPERGAEGEARRPA